MFLGTYLLNSHFSCTTAPGATLPFSSKMRTRISGAAVKLQGYNKNINKKITPRPQYIFGLVRMLVEIRKST